MEITTAFFPRGRKQMEDKHLLLKQPPVKLALLHGSCWETFRIFAYCCDVGNPHLNFKLLLPFQRQPGLKELGRGWVV